MGNASAPPSGAAVFVAAGLAAAADARAPPERAAVVAAAIGAGLAGVADAGAVVVALRADASFAGAVATRCLVVDCDGVVAPVPVGGWDTVRPLGRGGDAPTALGRVAFTGAAAPVRAGTAATGRAFGVAFCIGAFAWPW